MIDESRVGSSFDDFLDEQGMAVEVNAAALKRVLAWQLEEAMKAGHVSKTLMAKRMGTSRAALNRLLDKDNTSVTLKTLDKAASVLGKRIRVELV